MARIPPDREFGSAAAGQGGCGGVGTRYGRRRAAAKRQVERGDENLLWMTMSEAAERYGVPDTVMGRRLRQDEKRKSAAA
jgi:hypothetical protein